MISEKKQDRHLTCDDYGEEHEWEDFFIQKRYRNCKKCWLRNYTKFQESAKEKCEQWPAYCNRSRSLSCPHIGDICPFSTTYTPKIEIDPEIGSILGESKECEHKGYVDSQGKCRECADPSPDCIGASHVPKLDTSKECIWKDVPDGPSSLNVQQCLTHGHFRSRPDRDTYTREQIDSRFKVAMEYEDQIVKMLRTEIKEGNTMCQVVIKIMDQKLEDLRKRFLS